MDEQQLPPEVLNQPAQGNTTPLERLWALKLLRENMFYADPKTYGYTDIAEDVPNALKPAGHVLKNVLPSLAIINQDPQKRKIQIDKALQRIKNYKKPNKPIQDEMLHNAVGMGLGSIGSSLLLSALLGKFGIRRPLKNGRWRLPIELQNIKRLFGGGELSNASRKLFLKSLAKDTATNVGIAATAGAVYPWLANRSQVSDEALAQARKVMEQQPYLTSLPASEIMTVLQQKEKLNEPSSKLKNVGIGTGIGALTGIGGAVLPTLGSLVLAALTLGKVKPKTGLSPLALLKGFRRDAKGGVLMGGAFGGLSGLLHKDVINDEYQNIKEEVDHVPNPDSTVVPPVKPVSALATYRNQNEQKKPISYTV